jgi:hypothetical protein
MGEAYGDDQRNDQPRDHADYQRGLRLAADDHHDRRDRCEQRQCDLGPATQAWTVDNQGTITAPGGAGIFLEDGGAVINSGTILSNSSAYSVDVSGGGGFLTNSQSGYIGSGGVKLAAGGTVVNDGRIVDTNGPGVVINVAAGTVTNSGTISGAVASEDGVYLLAGGTVVPGSSRGSGVLAPARLLANGITIRQVESAERLEYFHIELDTHDVILAEGAPAETFVDCDNCFMFQNAAEFGGLYPDDRRPAWEFCAPRIEPGSAGLHAIRRALLARAEALGRVTHDPDLHLIADGEVIRAQSVAGLIWRFALPEGARALAIASRNMVPAETEAAAADGRALGVAVERIVLGGGGGRRVEIGHDCADLGAGFHADEGSHRWTDGRGSLPATLLGRLAGALSIEVHLAETVLRYRADPPAGEHPDATLPSEKGDWLAVI